MIFFGRQTIRQDFTPVDEWFVEILSGRRTIRRDFNIILVLETMVGSWGASKFKTSLLLQVKVLQLPEPQMLALLKSYFLGHVVS